MLANFRGNGGILAFAATHAWRAAIDVPRHGLAGLLSTMPWGGGFTVMNLFGWNQKTFRRNAIFLMALLTLVMLMHEVFGENGYLTLRRERKQYTNLQQQIHTLSQQNQELEQKINALKSNPEAVEKQARDQLHLAKPGEIIYMLPGKNAAAPPETAQRNSPSPRQPRR